MPRRTRLMLPDIASGSEARSLAPTFQDVGRRYVRYFNARHARSGTLWEGRFKSMLVDTDAYFLNTHRYIEQNPVRALMVSDPLDCAWSSHRHYAEGQPDDLVSVHAIHRAWFPEPEAFRAFALEAIPPDVLEALRAAARLQLPFGRPEFCTRIAQETGLPSLPRRPGPKPRTHEGSSKGEYRQGELVV